MTDSRVYSVPSRTKLDYSSIRLVFEVAWSSFRAFGRYPITFAYATDVNPIFKLRDYSKIKC